MADRTRDRETGEGGPVETEGRGRSGLNLERNRREGEKSSRGVQYTELMWGRVGVDTCVSDFDNRVVAGLIHL